MTDIKIFISHRSIDSAVANVIKELLIALGIDNKNIFCSSIPGYDVKYTISNEVYTAISQSKIDIILYSADYYESAYCRNEEGIIWYKNRKDETCRIIPIALPEINKDNLLGFIDSQHILRRLDNKSDIATIIDIVYENLEFKLPQQAIIQGIIERTIANYSNSISNRVKKTVFVPSEFLQMVNLIDARAILFYSLSTQRTEFSVQNVDVWLTENEYFDVDVLKGFTLLSELKYGTLKNNRFTLDAVVFNNMCKNSEHIRMILIKSLAEKHHFSRDTFISMWYLNEFSDLHKLFVAFLVDTKLSVLDGTLKKRLCDWENSCCIRSELKNLDFINLFIEKKLIISSKVNNSLVISKSFYNYLHNEFSDNDTLKEIKESKKITQVVNENHRND